MFKSSGRPFPLSRNEHMRVPVWSDSLKCRKRLRGSPSKDEYDYVIEIPLLIGWPCSPAFLYHKKKELEHRTGFNYFISSDIIVTVFTI